MTRGPILALGLALAIGDLYLGLRAILLLVGSALPGVAIAVALMPPLCTAGFGIGSEFSQPIIAGARLLFVANLAAITATALRLLVQLDALREPSALRLAVVLVPVAVLSKVRGCS